VVLRHPPRNAEIAAGQEKKLVRFVTEKGPYDVPTHRVRRPTRCWRRWRSSLRMRWPALEHRRCPCSANSAEKVSSSAVVDKHAGAAFRKPAPGSVESGFPASLLADYSDLIAKHCAEHNLDCVSYKGRIRLSTSNILDWSPGWIHLMHHLSPL